MGRSDVEVGDRERWVFERLAEDYRERPGWPRALADRLAALAGGAGAVAVDLGAGTGSLAVPLAERGLKVVAVEPSGAMLAVLRERAGVLPVEARQARAEETGLPPASARLAVLADVLQWVDPDATGRELARVLAPGGAVAVVEAELAGSSFAEAVREAVRRANPKARPRASGRTAQLLACAGAAVGGKEEWLHEELLEPARLDAVMRSLSVVGPALSPEALEALLAEARRLAAAHGGALWARRVRLTWGRRPA
jgi:ubiquinone/menaquinone biosynthesis C-methylase UbiE